MAPPAYPPSDRSPSQWQVPASRSCKGQEAMAAVRQLLRPAVAVALTIPPHSCMCNGQAEAVVLQPLPSTAPAIPLHCSSCQVSMQGQPMAQAAPALSLRQQRWKVPGRCLAFYHLEGEEGGAGARNITWLPRPSDELSRELYLCPGEPVYLIHQEA